MQYLDVPYQVGVRLSGRKKATLSYAKFNKESKMIFF